MARRPAKPKPSNPARPGRGIIEPPPAGSPAGYARFLEEVKSRIRTARVKAALSVNRELIQLYWDIGRDIVERQCLEGWGAAVIGRLATDIQREFPGRVGFSRANIYRIRAFHLAYPQDTAIVSQAARRADAGAPPEPMASLPWFHNVVLLESLKDPQQRLWYARQAVEHGWSRGDAQGGPRPGRSAGRPGEGRRGGRQAGDDFSSGRREFCAFSSRCS